VRLNLKSKNAELFLSNNIEVAGADQKKVLSGIGLIYHSPKFPLTSGTSVSYLALLCTPKERERYIYPLTFGLNFKYNFGVALAAVNYMFQKHQGLHQVQWGAKFYSSNEESISVKFTNFEKVLLNVKWSCSKIWSGDRASLSLWSN
jgi:hypothetical protein